jgi:hypothetical protein
MALLSDIATDLSAVFFAAEGFTVSASYSHAGGAAIAINVIFDDEFTGTNLSTGEIDTAAPQVRARTVDVSDATQGDTLIISSVTYYVTSVRPDGTGVSILQLSKKGINNG